MPTIPLPRPGVSTAFNLSFWPTRPSTSGVALQAVLFASDPWGIIAGRIKANCPSKARDGALAFLSQAEAKLSRV